MLENVKKYWPILAIAIVAGAFFAGRWSKKPDIKIQEKVVTHEVIKQVAVEKSQTTSDTNKQENKHLHITKVTVRNKDGSSTTTTTVDSDTHKNEVKTVVKYVDRIVYRDRVVEKKVDVLKTVTYPEPQWMASLKLGVGLNDFKPDTQFPYIQPLDVGVEIDRRILGPLWLGAWGMTDTHFKNVAGGLSLTMEF